MRRFFSLGSTGLITIRELLIVVTTLTIMASAAIPQSPIPVTASSAGPGLIQQAGEAICQVNRNTIQEAVELYFLDHEGFPGSVNQLVGGIFSKRPYCPLGGDYRINDRGVVSCTKHGV